MKVKLRDLGDIGNVIAALGVIISLLVVAWEINGNTAAIHAEANLSLTNLVAANNVWVHDAQFLENRMRWGADPDSLGPAETQQVIYYFAEQFNIWDQAFLLYEQGMLPEPIWEGWNRGVGTALLGPRVRDLWQRFLSDSFDDSFVAYVNRFYEQNPIPEQ